MIPFILSKYTYFLFFKTADLSGDHGPSCSLEPDLIPACTT